MESHVEIGFGIYQTHKVPEQEIILPFSTRQWNITTKKNSLSSFQKQECCSDRGLQMAAFVSDTVLHLDRRVHGRAPVTNACQRQLPVY